MLYHSSTLHGSVVMDEAALIAQYIVPNPLRPSADEARATGSDVPLRQIIRDLKAALGSVLAVAASSGLPREGVRAARTYYLQHAAVIDARIQAERQASGDPRQAA